MVPTKIGVDMASTTKRRNKRFGRKRAIRTLSNGVTQDSMSAPKRKWGSGLGK